ncbi:hypothetical protein [Nocardiopsis sp. Huas11]|uniref:hypothetical protein n=1 Tax=Nocardiopsis sp. Huas11 TaxID=2183912 RepID=UPI000EB146AB|nr:hypothetical protein [Nocardiopsis sp. Huas11]
MRARRGLDADEPADLVGPALRELAGLVGGEPADEVRRLVTVALRDLLRELPDDLCLAFLAGMGVHPDVRAPVLERRLEWVAQELHISPRTARRRMDQAIERVAAHSAPERPRDRPEFGPPDWRLAALRTRLSLGAEGATAVEEREIIAAVDDLDQVVVSAQVPRHGTERGTPHDVGLDLLHGAESVSCERVTETYFRHHIRFAQALRAGQRHVFAVRVSVPQGQPMRPQYVFRPLRRCDHFRLDVAFGSERPRAVWVVPGVPHGVVEDLTREFLEPVDRSAYQAEFTGLRPGLAYGLRWD